MKRYVLRSVWLNRPLAIIAADSPMKLRRACRERIGWRRSATLRYCQIGANSFLIVNRFGWPVMEAHVL